MEPSGGSLPSRSERLSLLMVRFLKVSSWYNSAYPYHSPKYVEQHIERADTDARELAEYQSTTGQSFNLRLVRLTLIAFSLSYCVRVIIYPLVLLNEFDLHQPANNLLDASHLVPGARQFSCLITNCTHLSYSSVSEQGWRPSKNGERSKNDIAQGKYDNASMRAAQQMVETFFGLPHFAICHPKLAYLHGTTHQLGLVGLHLAVSTSYAVLLTGVLLPVIQHFKMAGSLLIMFAVAPKVTRRVVCDRARQLLFELAYSRHCYKAYRRFRLTNTCDCLQEVIRKPTRIRLNSSQTWTTIRHRERSSLFSQRSCNFLVPLATASTYRTIPGLQTGITLSEFSSNLCNREEDEREEEEKEDEDGDEEEEEEVKREGEPRESQQEFAEDCVSIMRSNWWHAIIMRTFYVTIFSTVFYMSAGCLVGVLLLHVALQGSQNDLQLVGRHMRLGNCSMWTQRGGKLELLDLESYEQQRSLFRLLAYSLACTWPLLMGTLMNVAYSLTVAELTCWLYELKFQLALTVEFVRQLRAKASLPPHHKINIGNNSKRKHFEMQLLRDQFERLANMIVIYIECKRYGPHGKPINCRLKSTLAIERFVSGRIREGQLDAKSAHDLLEKLYVAFRIFLEQVHQHEPTVTIMVCLINLYSYGCMTLGALSLRYVEGYVALPIIWMITAAMTFLWCIVIASNFYAKAKGLNGSIWSLLAELCTWHDGRIEHMRHLWYKQVLMLDQEGGLALRALNVRITYMRIIQLIIAPGPILVIALRE